MEKLQFQRWKPKLSEQSVELFREQRTGEQQQQLQQQPQKQQCLG